MTTATKRENLPLATVPVIPLKELLRRLADDTVPPEEIRPYIILVPSASGQIDPEFQPNPARVSGLERGLEGGFLVASLNSYSRARRHREYRDRIASGWTGPRVVSEGDSWFQYPVFLDDIVDHLMQDHAVFSLDAAGDTLAGMIAQNEVIRAVEREKADAVLLSAGGNDLFANGKIGDLIEPDKSRPAAELVGARFQDFLDELMSDYRSMILRIRAAHPRVRIFLHGYAAAFSRMDRWIGRPLAAKGIVSPGAQNRVVQVMVERFNLAQKQMANDSGMGGKVFHVDLTGLGRSPEDWFDEIHMGSASNARAARAFAQALKAHLPALETALEGGSLMGAIAEDLSARLPVEAVTAHAKQLLSLEETHLMAELDRRIGLVELDPAVADLPSLELLSVSDDPLESGFAGISAVARRLLLRWEREFYELICGVEDADQKDRRGLREALGIGPEALVGALAGWLVVGPLGVPAVLAGVLAALLVKRIGVGTAEEVCAIWKERIHATRQ